LNEHKIWVVGAQEIRDLKIQKLFAKNKNGDEQQIFL
jgi:hypothetical protein